MAGFDLGADAGVEAAVAVLDESFQGVVGAELRGDFEAFGVGVHRSDVGVEQVDRLEGFPADFGVKVHSAAAQSTVFEDVVHRLGGEVVIGAELVGVPSEQHVAGVGIDTAQGSLHAGVVDFVHHGMTGQRGVVGFQIQFEVVLQVIRSQEIHARRRIAVILMLGRLFRFRLDQKLTGKPDLFGVVDGHVKEFAEVVQFPFHVGVVKVLITFTAAPEDIVLAAKPVRHLHRLFHLRRRVRVYVGVAGGGGAVHETRVREHVGGAPEQFDAAAFLFFLEDVGDGVEDLVGVPQRGAFGGHVAVVERVVGGLQFFEQFERHAGTILGILDAVGAVVPGADGGAGAERIGAGAAEGVPVDDREPQVVPHRFAFDHLLGVVPAEGERIVAVGAFVLDWLDVVEVGHC